MKNQVETLSNDENADIYAYIPFNEPDGGRFFNLNTDETIQDEFNNAWLKVCKTIKYEVEVLFKEVTMTYI